MRTRTQTLLVVAALLGTGVAPARGQNTASDPRWLAYLGCWEQVGAAKSHVCIVPAPGTSTVDVLTIVKGEVTARERVAAMGERVETTRGDCAGWNRADWSAHGQRLYLRSEDICPGETAHVGTGVIAMTGNGEWLHIQGMTIAGQTGLRVQRYREATAELLLPEDVAAALRPGVSSTLQARAAAGAPLAIDDVVEASHNVDTAVLEAWLVERAEPFTLDAKRLIGLADAGVPSRVIDLMVALSYPKVFAINAASRQGERLVPQRSYGLATAPVNYIARYDPLCYTYDYDFMYPYSYDCGRGYGYGYGYGFYPGGYPVTIIYNGSGGGSSSRPHGRVVNGQGYAKGSDGVSAQALPRPSDTWSQTSSGSSSGSTGTGAQGSSSTSGSSEQRTAKPRPPQ